MSAQRYISRKTRRDLQLKALGWFKDWSNYMLLATVAALGWVTKKTPDCVGTTANYVAIISLALSVVFAIFTLAMIPLVAERLLIVPRSFYRAKVKFKLFWLWGPECAARIKLVCWPQHVLFIVGVLSYAIGALPRWHLLS